MPTFEKDNTLTKQMKDIQISMRGTNIIFYPPTIFNKSTYFSTFHEYCLFLTITRGIGKGNLSYFKNQNNHNSLTYKSFNFLNPKSSLFVDTSQTLYKSLSPNPQNKKYENVDTSPTLYNHRVNNNSSFFLHIAS